MWSSEPAALAAADVRPRGRRAAVASVAALAAAGALAGCGFHLRGEVTYPFESVYINAPTAAPLASELRRTLEGSGARLVPSAADGQVVLEVSTVADDKSVLSLSGGGRAREYQLSKRVTVALHDAKGRDWMPAAEIVVRRSFTFNESEVLAREHEEFRLLREMQTDVVGQILRRLRAARNPA